MKTHRASFGFLLSVSLTLALLTLFFALAETATGQPTGTTIIVTNTNDSGPGSLRQAILDVDAGGIILFDPGVAGGRIVLTSGQLVISQSLTVDASAAVSLTVDGNRADRVLTIEQDTAVELIALTITGGQGPVNDEETIGHGGGILNLGRLTLTGCQVFDNWAGNGRHFQPDYPFRPATPGGDGGGIFNAGRLRLRETTVISNTAGSGGQGGGSRGEPAPGASGGHGGGVSSVGILEIDDSVVKANKAGEGGSGLYLYWTASDDGDGGDGGGVYNTGTLTITNTFIENNVAGYGQYPDYNVYWAFDGSSGGDGGGIYVATSGRLTLSDSIVRGNSAGSGHLTIDHYGEAGGGLFNDGIASITHSEFTSNHAGRSEGIDGNAKGGDGGAIANYGTLVLRDSVLDANSSGASVDGGGGGHGGGLWNQGVAHLIDSTIVNNWSHRGSDGRVTTGRPFGTPGGCGGHGGGIWNKGSLLLLRVTLDANQAGDGGLGSRRVAEVRPGLDGGDGGSGGGVWNSGQVVISQTTLSHNRAGAGGDGGDGHPESGTGGQGGDGGGLANQGHAALTNSTVSGNIAGAGGAGGSDTTEGDGGDGGRGGGISNGYSLTLENCTITDNRSGSRGQGGLGAVGGVPGTDGAGGGVYGTFAARDTILADNSAPGTGPDCAGRLYAGSHNLMLSPVGCDIDSSVVDNVIGLSPALLPLTLNAPGTTATHELFWRSPAVDAGSCSNGSVTHDQRGVLRPQGAGCDIGAYEHDGTANGWLIWLPLLLAD